MSANNICNIMIYVFKKIKYIISFKCNIFKSLVKLIVSDYKTFSFTKICFGRNSKNINFRFFNIHSACYHFFHLSL